MQIQQLGIQERNRWDSFVAQEPQFALMQSWDWGVFKEKLGWKAFRIAVEEGGRIVAGAQMLIKPLPTGIASVAYIPRGPVGNWLDEGIMPALLDALHRLARSHCAIFLKIEPPLLNDPAIDQILQQHQFKPSAFTNQPRTTIILNLDQSLDDLSLQMRKKTRQYIRRAEHEGIIVRRGGQEDLPAFYELMQKTGQREHFTTRRREFYEHELLTLTKSTPTVLLMAYLQEKLLAVRTAHCFGGHAAEFHAGSADGIEDLHPNYLLVWEAVKWAKAQGCCTYDLWGIPDEIGPMISAGDDPPASNRTDGLWGVYRFKSGFGKNIVSYIGAYDHIYYPIFNSLANLKISKGNPLDRLSAWLDSFRFG